MKSSNQVKTRFDPELPIILSRDVSNIGISAVLAYRFSDHVEKPISYVSRELSSSEKYCSAIRKEALAIVWAVITFYQYLSYLVDNLLLNQATNPH